MPAYDLASPAQQQEGLLGVALRVLQAATWRRNTYTDFPEDVHFLRRTVAAWTASTPRLASTAGLEDRFDAAVLAMVRVALEAGEQVLHEDEP